MTDLPASLAYARQWALQNRPAWEGAPQHARAPRRPLPQSMRPAWEGATRPYDMPFTAMHDSRTLPMDPLPRLAQRQQQNDLAQFAMQREAGRNEVNTPPGTYFGQDTLEMTGLPSIARGVGHLRDGEPGEALPEMALGGLGVFGMVGGGGGAHAPPPRIPRIPRTNPVMDMADLGRLASQGFDEADAGFFGRMASDEMPTPEQALGRPLTPDHIWNDPRFTHRLSITSDLEGIKTPEERFHIAGERIEARRAQGGGNDLDNWRGDRAEQLPTLLRREQEIGPGHDVESLITMARNMRNGEFPRALETDLGEYGVGGSQQNTPLLGTPEIGADPMARPTRPGFGQRPPTRTAPNEDRYLFGRLPRQPEAASTRPQATPTRTPDWLVRNPSEEDLARIASRGDEMKYVMDTDGNVYAFSAADGHHNQAMRALRDSGVQVRPLGPGAEVTDPDAAGFIWRNQDGTFTHEDANMVASGPYGAFQQRMRPAPPRISEAPDAGQTVRAYRGASVPYEGNNGAQFWSDDPGIASSNAMGDGANVTRADLALGRTLDVDGRGNIWDNLDPEGIPDEAIRREFAQRIHTMDPSRPNGGYGWFDVRTTDRLGQIARRYGYDSVTLRNVIEGGAPVENGVARPTTTYAIFGDRARFPTSAPSAGSGSTGQFVDIPLNDSRVAGGGGQRAITLPRNPETFNAENAWREGEFLPESGVGGYLQYDPQRWRVSETHLDPDLRSQRLGVQMYEELLARARRAGQPHIESDGYVSPDAQHVYEALERRGYHVIRREGRNGPTYQVETRRTQSPDGGPAQAGRAPLGRGRSKTVYDDPADPARVIVEMPPDPVTEAFLQFSRDAHARGLPFARHLPNPDAVESAGNVVRYRTERLAPNDTRARVGRENGEFFITGVDDAEQSGSIIAAMNALDDHLRRTLPPNTPRHFYDLGPQNFMRRRDGTLVINDPVESTGFTPRTGPNAGASGAGNAAQSARGLDIPLKDGSTVNFRATESTPQLREVHWDILGASYGDDVNALAAQERALRRQVEAPGVQGTPEGDALWRQISDLATRRLNAQVAQGQRQQQRGFVEAFRAVERALGAELDANAGRGVTYYFYPDKAGLEPIYSAWARRFRHHDYRIRADEVGGYYIEPRRPASNAPNAGPPRTPPRPRPPPRRTQ